MSHWSYTTKLLLGAATVALSICATAALFWFGAPLAILALPLLIFEAITFKLLIVDREYFGNGLRKMFPARSTAFGFAHAAFYAMWGWIYVFTLDLHPNPYYLETYFVPWFAFLFCGVLYSIIVVQYQLGSRNKDPSGSLSLARAVLALIRVPIVAATMVMDLLAMVFLTTIFTIGAFWEFNPFQYAAIGLAFIVLVFVDGALFGLLQKTDEQSLRQRLAYATGYGWKRTFFTLASLSVIVALATLHINLLWHEPLKPEHTWLILFLLDIVIPLFALAWWRPRYLSPHSYLVSEGDLVFSSFAIGGFAFLVSVSLKELPFLSDNTNALLDLLAMVYFLLTIIAATVLVQRGLVAFGEWDPVTPPKRNPRLQETSSRSFC